MSACEIDTARDAVRNMVLASPRLTGFAGGVREVERMLGAICDEWLDVEGRSVHLDRHPCKAARATIIFQPGSGAHARNYFLLGGLLARHGYEVLAIDRFGHGLSSGARGDCTVEEAIAIAGAALEFARSRSSRPVVLMGSSLGGLLTVFGLLQGLTPDVAIAHNFLYPGRLVSFRLRARIIARYRSKPYPLAELVHGFADMSDDPAVREYLRAEDDPLMAWALSARSVASLYSFHARANPNAPKTLVMTGSADTAIPAWATRLFTRFSGLPATQVEVLPNAGHLLFHDHLDVSVPCVVQWLDEQLAATSRVAHAASVTGH